jgi:hypothetical protein
MSGTEPTIADVQAQIGRQFEVIGLELRALRAEMVAGFAELRVDISGLRQTVQELKGPVNG